MHRLSPNFVLLLLASHIAVDQVVAQTLSNGRYQVAVVDADTISISETVAGAWEFDLGFTVFSQSTDPNIAMKSINLGGANYRVPQWDKPGGGTTQDVFQAGAAAVDVLASGVSFDGASMSWSFAPQAHFDFSAKLTVPSGNAAPALSFQFTPSETGYYGIGYTGAPATALSAVDEIWQPLVWQEKRFPTQSYLTPAYQATVPAALVTRNDATVGVVVDAGEFAYDPLPVFENSRFGVAVRDRQGNARPLVFAPILGGEGSYMEAGETYEFTMRPHLSGGETEQAFEQIAREMYGFHDYRRNDIASLNDVLENMIDYGLSDFSNFREELKGAAFDTDVPGAVKNVSSLNALDIAIVTDNREIYSRRAYPTLEYMLSREDFLFTTDRTQTTGNPSYTLSGPTAPVSELAALARITGGATPAFEHLARDEFGRINTVDPSSLTKTTTWQDALHLYRATGNQVLLEHAKEGADAYIAERIATPQTGYRDADGVGAFFWNRYAPDFANLYELYQTTDEPRFLHAAQESARRFTQFVWMAPLIPDGDILVNEGGVAPHYPFLAAKGHPQMEAPEELVEAWRLSEVGLTPEASGTAWGHRAIFMANYAPTLLRIGHDSDDPFLQEIARSAVIGRYANFPGYHINTDRTTVYEKADYPLREFEELSYNTFHYNHVWPAMTMVLDYLVSQAVVRSDDAISFPTEFIEGFAYFQNRYYGQGEGQFFDYDDALLWMPTGLVDADSVEVNYVSARGDGRLYLALMNELDVPLTTTVTLDPLLVPEVAGALLDAEVWVNDSSSTPIQFNNGTATLTLPPRGLTGLAIAGIDVQTRFQNDLGGIDSAAAWDIDLVEIEGLSGRAMILQMGADESTAYFYLNDHANSFSSARLRYEIDGASGSLTDPAFPWEFTLPLSPGDSEVEFVIEGLDTGGTPIVLSSQGLLRRMVDTRVWQGTTGVGAWEIAGTPHWQGGDGKFNMLDEARFDDSASGDRSVSVPTSIDVYAAIVDSTGAYDFSGPGTVTLYAGLTKQGPGTATFRNPLASTDDVTVEEGALILAGDMRNLQGNFLIAPGAVLQLGVAGQNGNVFPDRPVAVVNDGWLVMAEASTGETVYGGISGSGGVRIESAALFLRGNNTYTGQTLVNGGRLELAGLATLEHTSLIDVAPAGVFDVGGTNSASFSLRAGQTLDIDGSMVGSLTVDDHARLTGRGTLEGNLLMMQQAALAIEILGTSPGEFTSLTLEGHAVVDGTIEIAFGEDFSPIDGQQFTILTGLSVVDLGLAIAPDHPGIRLLTTPTSLVLEFQRLPGDYNWDGEVNLADYTVWRDTLGRTGTHLAADGTGPALLGVPDGTVDVHDYLFWKANVGLASAWQQVESVSEPSSVIAFLVAVAACPVIIVHRRRNNEHAIGQ